ncbi:MAG: hypothetical protein LAN36_05870 [Acidobacteriia bacterium]|nr:hypothetical protein [Terriglobia bacterium]
MRNRPRPSAPHGSPPEILAGVERRVLRALCGGTSVRALLERIVAELKDYRWSEPEHKVVFEALTRIRSHDLKALQAQLPAQTTRMGFPDVDWTIYLGGAETPASEIETLIEKLKAETKDRS